MIDTAQRLARQRMGELARKLVDPRIGLLRSIREEPLTPGAPELFHVYALASNTRAFTRQTNFANSGGASTDRMMALGKAVGEAVERYCGAVFDYAELPLSSRAEAPFACTEPDSFALFSEAQYAGPAFKYARFDDDTTARWTPAFDPLSGERVHLPAGMVYVPYYYFEGEDGRDHPVVQPISTGLACHGTPERAAISAICEVIERDAFTITWQARLSMPHIVVEGLDAGNYDLARRFELHGLDLTLLDLTMDAGVPTVMAVLRSGHADEPALVVAAATDPDPETAVRKSLEEVGHTRRYSEMVKRFSPAERLAGFAGEDFGVREQQDHLLYWSLQEHAGQADFLCTSEVRREPDELQGIAPGADDADLALLRRLCERVAATGHRVLLADLTTPDVAELGLHVMRAVIPGFHPMFMGHAVRSLASRRLREVPVRLGFGPRPDDGEANPLPHPYP